MIESYFQAEKQNALWMLGIGILACSVAGGVFLSAGAPFYAGLAIPLALIGFLQVTLGAATARRSDFQAADLVKLQQQSPSDFRKLEYDRVQTLARNLTRMLWLECAFVALGLAIILLTPPAVLPKGIGAGLFAQGCIQLFFDFFANKRAKAYLEYISQQS